MLASTATPAQAEGEGDPLAWVGLSTKVLKVQCSNGSASSTTSVISTFAQRVPGDFSSQYGTDLLLYNPGTGADRILHADPASALCGWTLRTISVNGNYMPVVGDFDGNAIDDILWYAPGTGADSLWLFKPDGSHTTKAVTINGNYQPVAINTDGDGYSDILWYAAGSAGDSIWRFGPSGNHTVKAITINGSYKLIPGFFGVRPEGSPQRRLLMWNPSGSDWLMTFDTSANATTVPMPNVDGAGVIPVIGHFIDTSTEDILYYRPGTGGEVLTGFTDGGAIQQYEPPNVNGTYTPAVGDYDANGYDDIAWYGGANTAIWSFHSGGYTPTNVSSPTGAKPAALKVFRFPA